MSTFILIIILGIFYALIKTVSGLAAEVNTLQNQLRDLTVTEIISDLAAEVNALQKALKHQASQLRLLEIQEKETDLLAFSARIKPSCTDIEPWATIVFSNVETNVGNSYSGTSG